MDNVPLESKLRFSAVYAQGIVENEARNRKIVDVAKTFRDEGKNCLTLVNRVSHGKDLTALMKRSDINAEFVYGKSTKEERDQAFEDLFSGKLDNIVATAQIVGEGSDFPQLECLINATGGKGGGDASDSGETGRVTIQIIGRGMRKHPKKKTFDYVDFLDNSHRFLKNASRDRISTLRSEGYTEFIDFWENRKNGNG
jgi:superfamily II DNA or RNA helicase